jgi:lipoprotein-releasing system permease protein
MSFEAFIGLRHLKGQNRSRTVSLLTLISILGVIIGVWALIVVLSVLSGFGQDLRNKIIDSSPHMIVERHMGELVQQKTICKTILGVPDTKACSPFIINEIMLVSATNTATSGALLRGIVQNSPRIRSLTKQMRSGSFEHMFTPEKIPTPRVKFRQNIPLPLLRPQITPTTKPGDDMWKFPDVRDLHETKKRPKPKPKKASNKQSASTMKRIAPPPSRKPSKDDDSAGDDSFALPFGERKTPPPTTKKKVLPGILLGQELAQNLSVSTGDVLRAVSPIGGTLTPMGPSPRTHKYRVAGIFYTGMYEYDTKFAFVALPSAQKLFKMTGVISGLEIEVKDLFAIDPVKKGVQRAIGGGPYRVKDWREMNSQLFGALKTEKVMMFLILALIVIVASFYIVSTLTMVVLEKAEEIAILKSMGATRASIMRVFMIQGVSIGFVGTVIGLLLGWRTCLYLINHPIKMDQNLYYILHLPVHMRSSDFIAVALASIAISFLATIYPALQAARLHPVEGLQHE